MKAMMRKTLSAPGMLKLLDAAFRKIELPLRQASCRHSTSDCLKFVLAMFKMKWASLLETERNLKELSVEAGNLKRLFGMTRIPSDETVRRRLGMIAPRTLDRAFASVIAALQRGKALERMTRLDGHYLMAIDGTRTYQSKCKSCSRCLKTHHGDGSITYSHSELFAVLKRLSTLQNANTTIRYLENNRARMDYPRCRREGLPCSSSRVESACKNVVGARMKRDGMRWTVNGANAILALRCSIKSGCLDGYFDRVKEAVARELRAFAANPI